MDENEAVLNMMGVMYKARYEQESTNISPAAMAEAYAEALHKAGYRKVATKDHTIMAQKFFDLQSKEDEARKILRDLIQNHFYRSGFEWCYNEGTTLQEVDEYLHAKIVKLLPDLDLLDF